MCSTGIHVNQLFRWFSLQTTHVLRVYNVLSIHRWSELKPAKKNCGNPAWALTPPPTISFALILSTEGGNTQPYNGIIKGDGNCGVLGIAASQGQNQQVRSLPWIVSHSVIARCELNYWIRQSFRGLPSVVIWISQNKTKLKFDEDVKDN